MIIYGIIALGILVFVHELGHFLVAKFFKVGVVEFSIGFGKKIWKRKWGETTYAFGIVPLGGYVRMVGDDPRLLEPESAAAKGANPADFIEGVGGKKLSADADPKQLDAKLHDDLHDNKEEMSQEELDLLADESKWFLKKGYWPKVAIVLAGPLFNIGFALVTAFVVLFFYGKSDWEHLSDEPIIGAVTPFFPADKAGIKRLDLVKSLNGKDVRTWTQLADTIAAAGEVDLTLMVERKDSSGSPLPLVQITVMPTYETKDLTAFDDETPKERRSMIGIQRYIPRTPVTLRTALLEAPQQVWFLTKMTVIGLQKMVTGKISTKSISGPLGILDLAGRSAEDGVDSYFNFLIFLSVSLAVFNLLPIPILDGGHLLFFTLGAIKGQPVSLRTQQVASQIGMVALLALMAFAFSMDVYRFAGSIGNYFMRYISG